jgi:hypothetical protein
MLEFALDLGFIMFGCNGKKWEGESHHGEVILLVQMVSRVGGRWWPLHDTSISGTLTQILWQGLIPRANGWNYPTPLSVFP